MGTYEGMAAMDTYQYEADTHQYKPDTYQREFPDDSSIEIAYLIAATITTAVGCLHFTLYAYFMLHRSRNSSDSNQIALTAADDDNKNLELNQANDSTICPHNSAWGKGDDVKNNNNVAEAPDNALEKCDDVTSGSKDAMTWRDIVTPSKWAAGDGRFGVIIALLTVLFYMFLLFSAKGVGGYLTVYAVDSGLGFTNAEAARLQSAVMVFAIIGDASAMFLAKYWSAGVMLVIQTHGQLLCGFLMLGFGTRSKLGLRVTSCLYTAVREPSFASGYTWSGLHIILYAFILSMISLVLGFLNIFMNAFQVRLTSSASCSASSTSS